MNESFFGSPLCCKFGEDQDAVIEKECLTFSFSTVPHGVLKHSLFDTLYFKVFHSPSKLSPFDSGGKKIELYIDYHSNWQNRNVKTRLARGPLHDKQCKH